jgi:hypothetical protein
VLKIAMGDRPYFKVALNLPHAGRIARRIGPLLPSASEDPSPQAATARQAVVDLQELLEPILELDENPPGSMAIPFRDRAAVLGRQLVDAIEAGQLGHDRLGQCVRNLFECLELGPEGAAISLRAGENPKSLQRPY